MTNHGRRRWSPTWSCDSVVATPAGSASGATVFGKNSDRPAGEAQPLRQRPAHDSGGRLRLAQIEIDDAPAYAHLGSAPFWCWGYESGVNEHRVAIGNEALFTRPVRAAVEDAEDGKDHIPGILGMELVRLGLERASTAREALDVITGLLERHGQWGSGKFGEEAVTGAYDNSFLIADPTEAWILETAGRAWAARRAGAVDSISNEPSIRTSPDLISSDALALAREHGWQAQRDFDFAAAFTDPLVPLQVSHIRRARSAELLERARAAGGVDNAWMRRVLRDHLEDSFLGGPYFDAATPDFLTLCMHEHPSGFTWGNTASSLIAELPADPAELDIVWWAAVTPCTTLYLPVFPSTQLPDDLTTPRERPVAPPSAYTQDRYDDASYWWRTQRTLDAARRSGRFAQVQQALRDRLKTIEHEVDERVAELREAWRINPGGDTAALARELTAETIVLLDTATSDVLAEAGINRGVDPRWA